MIRLGNIGSAKFRNADEAYIPLDYFRELQRHEVREGDLIIAGLGDSNHPVGRACLAPKGLGPAIVKADCFRARLDETRLTHRYAAWALSSSAISQQIRTLTRGTTRTRINLDVVREVQVPMPQLEDQRRIADFLDAETALIDQLIATRASQSELLDLLLGQLIDGAVAGTPEALEKLGVPADGSTWGNGKTSRLCEVIPGYAFPSEGFSHGSGTRLLRGVNVSVDRTSWVDCAWWDETSTPTPERFHLRAGDLVIGMDRPWISGGTRITFINEEDLPALLLQRVACLRPKSTGIDMDFLYWNLRSSHFRRAVEGELTGVSVPHLSGDQIGSFSFPLPDAACQKRISDRLTAHSARIRELRSRMTRQAGLLTERRQSLITAAVTGQFDVSTASGRNVTDGVSA
ncbi:restriction endonuclease subunit S [Streptomyces sp. NBC_01185]|uniref:restriction endonuclease subunit S n=1 Tax=Streptomyces sp. NBC_01185 TaxID=2903764 RepID=UPI00386D3484|nr:restriction endonuclease subunit S [Streptomyces sp. NBC_01185]